MSTERISLFDAAGKARTDDGSTINWFYGTPVEIIRGDAVLIWVRWGGKRGLVSSESKQEVNKNGLVNITLEGYKFFSFSVKGAVTSFEP